MDRTVRAFFSQPMRGLSDEEIKLERAYMISEFRDFLINTLGYADDVVIQDVNYIFNNPGSDDSVGTADYIVFHMNWRKANGCWVEKSASEFYFKWRFGDEAGQGPISDHISCIAMGNIAHDT